MGGICRVGDNVSGICQANAIGHPRSFIGTWVSGSSNILHGGIGVIRTGDSGITDCGHHIIASGGSLNCSGDGLSLQRIGDPITILEGGYGTSISGSNNLFIN